MEKRIKDFEDYAITTEGKVISYKYKQPRVMKTWYQTGLHGIKNTGYENIKLCKCNKNYHFLIHRLVAEAFIPNPDNLPEVNHKNKNVQDNRLENLEWCSRIDNLIKSYSTMSPTRNFINCRLYDRKNKQFIKDFNSIRDAARFVEKQYGESYLGMLKNLKTKNYYIEKVKCND